MGICGGRETRGSRENPWNKDWNQQQTQPTFNIRYENQSKGHSSVRRALSPLCHSCNPNNCKLHFFCILNFNTKSASSYKNHFKLHSLLCILKEQWQKESVSSINTSQVIHLCFRIRRIIGFLPYFDFLPNLTFFPFLTPFFNGFNFTDFLTFLSCLYFRCSVSFKDILVVSELSPISECFLFLPGTVATSLGLFFLWTFGKSSEMEE